MTEQNQTKPATEMIDLILGLKDLRHDDAVALLVENKEDVRLGSFLAYQLSPVNFLFVEDHEEFYFHGNSPDKMAQLNPEMDIDAVAESLSQPEAMADAVLNTLAGMEPRGKAAVPLLYSLSSLCQFAEKYCGDDINPYLEFAEDAVCGAIELGDLTMVDVVSIWRDKDDLLELRGMISEPSESLADAIVPGEEYFVDRVDGQPIMVGIMPAPHGPIVTMRSLEGFRTIDTVIRRELTEKARALMKYDVEKDPGDAGAGPSDFYDGILLQGTIDDEGIFRIHDLVMAISKVITGLDMEPLGDRRYHIMALESEYVKECEHVFVDHYDDAEYIRGRVEQFKGSPCLVRNADATWNNKFYPDRPHVSRYVKEA